MIFIRGFFMKYLLLGSRSRPVYPCSQRSCSPYSPNIEQEGIMSESTGNQHETRIRAEIPEHYRWDLTAVFPDWTSWEKAMGELEAQIGELATFKGLLSDGTGEHLLAFMRLHDKVSILSYRVWYFPSLEFDTDQRDNLIDARRQRVQELFARFNLATSWYSPEVLSLGIENVRQWMDHDGGLALYRFSLEELFRQAEHVLNEQGEHLMALSSRFSNFPSSTYQMLSTADARFKDVILSTGETVTVTPGAYRSLLTSVRNQSDREQIFRAHYSLYEEKMNSYASIYAGVLQKGWFHAQARSYPTVLDSSLHGDNVPVSIVETLVNTTRRNAEPMRRYHRLRRKFLALDSYHLYDGFVSLVEREPVYSYDSIRELILSSVKPLGKEYVERMERAFSDRWIDVYENEGKRSGAYSAGVYGVHPYILLNYKDTLDDIFTFAHELGHSMHSLLSDETQPFVYSQYTIFVAEVASTMNEALLLDELLHRTSDPFERVLLLQHAIDGIVGTYFTQVLFTEFELNAHHLVESGEPVTAEALGNLYGRLLDEYYGDTIDKDELYRVTWARIPHFFHSPYYVYQYATSFASSAKIFESIRAGSGDAKSRYLKLLRSGGSDHPMTLLNKAGADLNDPATTLAVSHRLDELVNQLEEELALLNA
jgi:oligoendopeptidase F